MGITDILDPRLAPLLAWSYAPPAHVAVLSEDFLAELQGNTESDPPLVAPMPVDRDASLQTAIEICAPFADPIDEAWAHRDDEDLVARMKKLIARVARARFHLQGMLGFLEQAVRFLRLCLKVSPSLSRRQRDSMRSIVRAMPLDHPEAADLLVEVATAGDKEFFNAMFDDAEDWRPGVGNADALVARLGDVVDRGPEHAQRCVAIELLARFPNRAPAVAALRRALRLPSFAVRARALDTLARAEPCALEPADLVYVLRDPLAHTLPDALGNDAREEDESIFADAVIVALAHVRPEEAGDALLDWIDAEFDSIYLGPGWATEALAVGFPETGAVMTDHWLKCAQHYSRYKALAALSRLPPQLAEPRLRLALADPSESVREPARRDWRARFHQSGAARVQDLVGSALLEGPPSERFLARLAAIHGRVAAAHQKLLGVLLEEPDREALVLLLQLLCNEVSKEPSVHQDKGWAGEIAKRFGALGVEGLCAVAQRFCEPETFGWMRRLGDLVEQGVILVEQAAPLRALAAKRIASNEDGLVGDCLRILRLVGPPPELLDRVLELSFGDEPDAWEARRLVGEWPDRSLDSRIVSTMAMALADRDWDRLGYAAWMAFTRNAIAARVVAQRVFEVIEECEDGIHAATMCAQGMKEVGALDEAWARAALARPESPLFIVAVHVWRTAPGVRLELEQALASPARAGASAAEAAGALIQHQPPLSTRDKRLRAVLEAAPAPERASLLVSMCTRSVPFGSVEPFLEELLVSSDPRVTSTVATITRWFKLSKVRPLLKRVLPRVVDAELRADIEDQLGAVPDRYWAEG